MKNNRKLLGLSALLILVVLVSFCAVNILSGDAALATIETNTVTGYSDDWG